MNNSSMIERIKKDMDDRYKKELRNEAIKSILLCVFGIIALFLVYLIQP